MPKLSLSIPHRLGKERAMELVKDFAEKIHDRFHDQAKNIEHSWEDNKLNFSFRTMGMNFKGALTVEEEVVNVEGELPFAAMMFKGKIEQGFREELTKLLASNG